MGSEPCLDFLAREWDGALRSRPLLRGITEMAAESRTTSNSMSVAAYRGDAKTLLAFDLTGQQATDLAGFTIQARPPGVAPYYLYNTLRFQDPAAHTQVASESPNSSVNAPFHKFRWLHVPGSVHQGLSPVVRNVHLRGHTSLLRRQGFAAAARPRHDDHDRLRCRAAGRRSGAARVHARLRPVAGLRRTTSG